jgi:hypothetical protein
MREDMFFGEVLGFDKILRAAEDSEKRFNKAS